MYIRSGYSLTEAIVVICIFMLLASMSGIYFSSIDTIQVKTEIHKLFSTCYLLRQRAMATNREIRLILDPQQNCYYYEYNRQELSPSVIFGTATDALGPPSLPKHNINNPITFTNNSIIFYPTGIIQSGIIYLTNKKRTCSYAMSNAVSQFSYLRLYEYRDKKWHLLK